MRRTMFLAGLVGMVGGCDPGRGMVVKHYWFPAASPYGLGNTYAWAAESEDDSQYNPDYRKLMRELVDRGLAEKKYALAASGKADFWVHVYFGKFGRQSQTGSNSWDEAALVIEAVKPHEGTVLWRGWLEARIEYSLPPADRRERVRIGVEKILRDLPRAE